MSKRKRWILLALALVLVLALSACRKKTAETPEPDAQTPASETRTPEASGDQTPDAPGETTPSMETGKTVEEMLADKNALEPELTADGVSYALKKNVESYLVLGVDADKVPAQGSVDGLGQSDTILLYVVDNDAKKCTTLQINRDTMVEIDILGFNGKQTGRTVTQQICLAHSYGNGREASCENVVRAVSRLLGGLEIDGYASLRYPAIPALNDAVGGICVTIEDDFSEADPTLVQGETVELTGQHALNFVRGRMSVGDGTNISRSRRQRAYLNAFSKRLREEVRGNSGIINDLYNLAKPYMVTDMSLGTISSIAAKGVGYANGGIVTLSGESREVVYQNGKTYTEHEVDTASISKTVLELYYTEVN